MVPEDSSSEPPPEAVPATVDGPRPRARRRWARLLVRLVLVLAVLLGIALFFRLELVNRLGPSLLGRVLDVPADLTVTAFDWQKAHIDRLVLGSKRDLVVEDVTLAYDPLHHRLASVEIGRVALLAAIDRSRDTGISLGDLDPLVDRLRAMATEPGSAGTEAPLPDILVDQWRRQISDC